MEKTNLQDSPSFVDLCTLHQHAMRYYRLWIYACNTVLAVATLVFTVFAVSVLVDPRISLISGVELYQPTFLYAYVALLLQCGVLQTIGCLGALRLNQKLLNTYWTLLLVLMIGDIVVGLIWAFRLGGIKDALKPNLKRRLELEYGRDPDFTQVWDWVQSHEMCCGVEGPFDYNKTAEFAESNPDYQSSTLAPPVIKFLPTTCCTLMRIVNSSDDHEDSRMKGSSAESKRSHAVSFQVNTNPLNNPSQNINAITRRRIPTSRRQNYETKTDSGGGGGMKSQHLVGHGPNSSPHQSAGQRYPYYQHQQQHMTTESSSQSSHHTGTPTGGFQEICEIPQTLVVNFDSISDIDNNKNLNSNNDNKHINNLHVSSTEMSFKSSHSNTKFTKVDLNDVLKNPGVPSLEEISASSSSFSNNNPNARNVEFSSTPGPLRINSGNSPSTTGIPLHELLEQRRLRVQKHSEGCGQKILQWLDHVTDILFVIGFCIIVFLKGCFLAILRYEIKEMIQKIRLLNGEEGIRSATMNELIGLTSIYADTGSQGENEEGGGEGRGGNAARRSLDDCGGGLLSNVSKRQSGGSDRSGGNALLNTADTSLSNSNKHNRPHIGNHIGSHIKDRQDVEDDYDSSSALLGRTDTRARGKESSAPRTLPKNGNNNISANANTSSAPPDPPTMASSAP